VTARDLQRRDGQWTRAKGFDTFCPLGPWIETELNPSEGLDVRCVVNGDVRQHGTTADLVFDIPTLISYCAAFATLLPGDVILTGTPAGIGPLRAGDEVEVEVDGIGTLSNGAVPD
jgi:2-keto-4-pentenoate hydratase/2-oxohepta-3-ene-1,7-dioic acid hydratase in catechol pathway